jgi:2'-hydroxyisoflavone reductase
MKILIIGGTQFVGRHIVAAALARGHDITLFNRGKTNADLFPQAQHLTGDRKQDVSALLTDLWDVVIDACGYTRRDVRNTSQALQGRVKHYVFISTISVYASFAQANAESSTLGTWHDLDTETVDGDTYGPLKAACETIVQDAFAHHNTLVRPGLVVGPHDHTDRFTYWPARIALGGSIIAPNNAQDPVQYIDVRDLAAFTLLCAEQSLQGAYNVVGNTLGIGTLLQCCKDVAQSNAKFAWLPAALMKEQDVKPWQDMPLWMDPSSDTKAVALTRNDKAMKAGLNITPLADTVKDTLQWHQSRPLAEQQHMKAGLSAEREQGLHKTLNAQMALALIQQLSIYS